ncbi:hypothetical protein [Desulfoferrobacter suflitae]|uniref:hypothetical protein n=1 Tax=Desulfoferrobacter suflitae TaxID=2865782 RepID=UPI002164E0CB|nr:hypothetical protein [Desulfoferrobacter suflitae]MCK8601678.1 hypothetical protein [Desulfoferrobacter suflitae]
MSGIQEILVVLVIILILFYLPKRAANGQQQRSSGLSRALSGKVRLALVICFVWIACMALFLPPWQGKFFPFVYLGLGPVALGWGVYWVVLGFRKHW